MAKQPGNTHVHQPEPEKLPCEDDFPKPTSLEVARSRPIRECECGQPWRAAFGLYGTTEETRCQACVLRDMLKRTEAERDAARQNLAALELSLRTPLPLPSVWEDDDDD